MQFLDASRRPSVVIGGFAVIAHGFARSTADIDAAVVAQPEDAGALLRIARKVGLRERVPEAEQFAHQNLVLLLEHVSTGIPVDISFALQAFERRAAKQAITRKIVEVPIRVPPLTAVLIYKMVAGRAKDIEDVNALLQTNEPFDRAEVEATLQEFDALLEADRAGDFRRILRRVKH